MEAVLPRSEHQLGHRTHPRCAPAVDYELKNRSKHKLLVRLAHETDDRAHPSSKVLDGVHIHLYGVTAACMPLSAIFRLEDG